MAALVQVAYPEHTWLPWLFVHDHRLRRRLWGDHAIQRRFLDFLGERLGYSQPDDWCNAVAALLSFSTAHLCRVRQVSSASE